MIFFSLDQNGKHLISADLDVIDDLYEKKDFSGKESPFTKGKLSFMKKDGKKKMAP